MKSKGKAQGLTINKLFIILGAATLISVVLRVIQLFTIIDDESTGFYDEINWSVYALYVVLAVSMLLLFILPKISGRITASRPVIMKNRIMGIGAFIMAAGIAYDVVIVLSTFIRGISAFSSELEIGFFQYIMANGFIALGFESICGLIACIYMIMFGLSYVDGKTTFSEYKLIALMPLFWAMFKMVYRFMTKISFTQVSDLLFELFMLAFMMLFFMSFARISAGMATKGEMRRLVSYGLPAIMFALLIGITRFIVTIGGRGELLHANFAFSLSEPAFGIFAIIYINMQMKHGRPYSEDDLLNAGKGEEAGKNKTDDNFLGS